MRRGAPSPSPLGGAEGGGVGAPLSRSREKVARTPDEGLRRMTLIDSHCHLDFPDFAGDLDQVVERARAAGVERMITIGTKVAKAAAGGRNRRAVRRRFLHRRHASA